MKTIKFNKDYSKLSKSRFTTIRHPLSTKFKIGNLYQIKSPSYNFKVECVHLTIVAIGQLTDKFLMQDTDTKSRHYALKEILSFYPALDHCCEVLIVFLKQKECYIKLKNGKVLREHEDFLFTTHGFFPETPISLLDLGTAEFSPEFERKFLEMQKK